jgi:hypothetical protein
MLIVDMSAVKLPGEEKQNNVPSECGQPIDAGVVGKWRPDPSSRQCTPYVIATLSLESDVPWVTGTIAMERMWPATLSAPCMAKGVLW